MSENKDNEDYWKEECRRSESETAESVEAACRKYSIFGHDYIVDNLLD